MAWIDLGSEQSYKRRQFRQDHRRARVRVFNLRAAVFSSGSGPSLNTETRREAYLSAEQGRSQAAPWFPQAHANGWRPQDSCAPAREGPQSPVGLRPVTDGCMATAQVQPPRPPTARIATLKRRPEFLRIRKGARFATPGFVLEAKRRDDESVTGRRSQVRFHRQQESRECGGAQSYQTTPQSCRPRRCA